MGGQLCVSSCGSQVSCFQRRIIYAFCVRITANSLITREYHDSGRKAGASEQPKVNGFALYPKKNKAAYDSATYNQAAIKKSLKNPCDPSCEKIMLTQMREKWNWNPDFDVAKVPRKESVKVKEPKKTTKK